MSDNSLTNERASTNAEGSALMMELFNRMPIEALKSVPETIAKRIGDFMVANGYRFVFDRWYLQARPAVEPTEGIKYDVTVRDEHGERPLKDWLAGRPGVGPHICPSCVCAHPASCPCEGCYRARAHSRTGEKHE